MQGKKIIDKIKTWIKKKDYYLSVLPGFLMLFEENLLFLSFFFIFFHFFFNLLSNLMVRVYYDGLECVLLMIILVCNVGKMSSTICRLFKSVKSVVVEVILHVKNIKTEL